MKRAVSVSIGPAAAGKGRPLSLAELDQIIDQIGLKPQIQVLNP